MRARSNSSLRAIFKVQRGDVVLRERPGTKLVQQDGNLLKQRFDYKQKL